MEEIKRVNTTGIQMVTIADIISVLLMKRF